MSCDSKKIDDGVDSGNFGMETLYFISELVLTLLFSESSFKFNAWLKRGFIIIKKKI